MSETEEYLIYNPVSFIAPTQSPPPPKQKEPRRRKNAIVQLEQPSALEAIRQKAIKEQKQQKQQQHEQQQQQLEEFPQKRGRLSTTDRKVSTDSYLGGSDTANDEEHKDEHLPTLSRRRRVSKGVRKADGSYVSKDSRLPQWQLREKTKGGCYDYIIDEIFNRVTGVGGGGGGGGSLESNSTTGSSSSSFSLTNVNESLSNNASMSELSGDKKLSYEHSSNVYLDEHSGNRKNSNEYFSNNNNVSTNGAFSNEPFSDPTTGTEESETDAFSPYNSSYSVIREDDEDREGEYKDKSPFVRRICTHPSNVFRKFSMTAEQRGRLKGGGRLAASSSCPYLSTCTDDVIDEITTAVGTTEITSVHTPAVSSCVPKRRNRLISLPATINNTFKPDTVNLNSTFNNDAPNLNRKPVSRRGRKLSLEQSIENLSVRTRKPSVIKIESVL